MNLLTLQEAFAKYPDTDKDTLHSYAEIYEELFAPYRETATSVLEVGVRGGGSLKGWREWFTRAYIYGIDNGSEAGMWVSDDPRILVRHGDSLVSGSLHAALAQDRMPRPFLDIAIDDGCHTPMVQAVTWMALYPWVRSGGLYVTEDVESITHAQELQRLFGGEIIDRRHVKNRHDDILLVWKK